VACLLIGQLYEELVYVLNCARLWYGKTRFEGVEDGDFKGLGGRPTECPDAWGRQLDLLGP
jgi:hypothetical protein